MCLLLNCCVLSDPKNRTYNSRFTVLAIISHIDPPLTGAATCCCLLCARDERWFQCAGAQTAGWTAPTIRDRYITPLSFQHSDGWLSFGILWQTSALRVDLIPSLLLSEQNISYRQRSHVLLLGVWVHFKQNDYKWLVFFLSWNVLSNSAHATACQYMCYIGRGGYVIGLLCLSVFKQDKPKLMDTFEGIFDQGCVLAQERTHHILTVICIHMLDSGWGICPNCK